MAEVLIRPMTPADVVAAEQVSDEGFFALDQRVRRVSGPAPSRRTDANRSVWIARTRHLVETDPGGCWVAEIDGRVGGLATSLRRETVWCLATYAVLPTLQGNGIGRPLLAAALGHAGGATRGMLSSSTDPRAVRLYHEAGFALHPQMTLSGTVDRSALPAVPKVREWSIGDVEQMDSVDRRIRGAGHGPDHHLLMTTWRLLVSDTTTGSGYVYLDERGRPALLAATNRRTATRLLWAALAEGAPETRVAHVTGANQWALDVGFAAGLALDQDGYLGLRGMRPPAPYLHHGALL